MATLNRTVTHGLKNGTYVSVDNAAIVPELITRFSPGSKVEVRKITDDIYAVQAQIDSPLRVFGEEIWRSATV